MAKKPTQQQIDAAKQKLTRETRRNPRSRESADAYDALGALLRRTPPNRR